MSVDDDSLEVGACGESTCGEAKRRPRGDLNLEFEIAWSRCFVDSLRPSHLPEGWKVDHTIVPRARPPPSTSLVCRAHLKGQVYVWGRAYNACAKASEFRFCDRTIHAAACAN